MKLKNRDWTERERRLGDVEAPLLQQDRISRATLLVITIFGAVVLATVVGYLALYSPTSQDRAAREIDTQFWRQKGP
jgi:hypothetical protein